MAQIRKATEPEICKQGTKLAGEPISFVKMRAPTL